MSNPSSNLYLGIDTSNYTTSLALADSAGQIVLNLKKILPVKPGERGLRQSDAVFAHIKNLPELLEQLKAILPQGHLAGIGVSIKPRDAEDSYMPCFLVGRTVADSIRASSDCPVFGFSHQSGHIMAALYGSGALSLLKDREFAAFHVSGGTTEILHVLPKDKGLTVELIGGTRDLHAGQVIDRTGVRMGLPFPSGKYVDELALSYKGKIPPVKISAEGLYCHLSGLENLSADLFEKTKDPSLTSAYLLASIEQTLRALTGSVRDLYPDIPVLYAGGVMSSQYIKDRLGRIENTYFSKPEFSSDNACGTALLCRQQLLT
ncbi:MAG: peptidase M22 [Clostridia bacterium]|nr:peptidase M22 [Clostridia bacterium]